MLRPLLLLLCCPALLLADTPAQDAQTAYGDQIRDAYFRRQAEVLAKNALSDIKSREDWAKKQPELRRQFFDMMGFSPLPKRTDLQAKVTGTLDAPNFTVEKVLFQSLPGLYVTGNLYVPKKREGKLPGILYVCGHGASIIDKVSYGNKVTYQHHGAWFAEHGYVCLIVDTLQLGELQGLHHGTHRFGMWWWPALGYTPAGIELWNGIRALDYLESRKEVDATKLGVTGRSGGGATSWWVGAADERVKCVIPVAGIADLIAHVSEGYPGRLRDGVVGGHCDCMYFNNTYRWDYTTVMALCAPRALMLGNSDADQIFPVEGYRRMATKVKKLYEILGVPERFTLLETKGPHKDTPELRKGAFEWMNRWLKNDTKPIEDPERPRFKPQQLKVVDRAPGDSINDVVHERFRKPAKLELPESNDVAKEWWKGKAPQLRDQLREHCFRGWPTTPPDLNVKVAQEMKKHGVRVRAVDFVSEEKVPLRLWIVQDEKVDAPTEVIAGVVDEKGWREWLADLGPDFREVLFGKGNPAPQPYPAWNKDRFEQHRTAMRKYRWAFAILTPRNVGITRWSTLNRFDRKPAEQHILRRFLLLGQTLEGQQVWDVRRGIAALEKVKDLQKSRLVLQGRGTSAGLALYAGLFEDGVKELDLWSPPTSHRTGPTFMNVLTVLDMPQAVALAMPRRIKLHVKEEGKSAWEWPMKLQRSLGGKELTIQTLE